MSTDQPKLQVVPPVPESDPFDLEKLRLDPSAFEAVGGRKLLTTIPVRKPGPQTYVRVHPSPEYRGDFPVVELREWLRGQV